MLTKDRCEESRSASSLVDDVEHHAHHVALRLGNVAPLGVAVETTANHLAGGFPPVQAVQRGGQDLRAQPGELLVVGSDPLLQAGGPPNMLGAQVTDHAAAAHRDGRDRDHQECRAGSAQADGDPGRPRHQGDTGPGHRGHQYRRQQQYARVGKFTATGRRLNTHHVCPLRQIG
jgi:hypothetical protein